MPDQRRPVAPPPAPPRPPVVHPTSREASPVRPRPQFQFGLRSLLILVTVVAIVSPLIPGYGLPILMGLLITLLMVVTPVTLGAFALYCRGYRQTFFLGAFAASLSPFLFGGFVMQGTLSGIAALAVVQTFACGVCGYLAVASRRYIERRGWNMPDDKS